MLTIGIAGGTGSGKTTILHQILKKFPEADICVISQDSYYNDTSELSYEQRVAINFDHPDSIDFELLKKHISQLKKGNTIQQPIYSFVAHNRIDETLTTIPKKVLIIEGILILADPKIRPLLDLKIYVETDNDERLIRRLKRDISERGRDMNEVLERYQTTLKPMHEQFIKPSKMFADIIIPNNHYNTVAVDMVQTIIKDRLK